MTRYNIRDYRESKASQAIEIEGDDGQVFTVPAPELWPDSVLEHAQAGDEVGAAKALLGDDYDAFTKAGGTLLMLADLVFADQGATVGESGASPSS